jgi:hypothetical protein
MDPKYKAGKFKHNAATGRVPRKVGKNEIKKDREQYAIAMYRKYYHNKDRL